MLFARDVVLVEGIAEMLLLPALANYLFADPTLHEDEQGRLARQFRSATIVSVEGVDFDPYLRLLLAGDEVRVDRVIVVTDRDHTGAGDARKAAYEASYSEHVKAGRLHVVVGGTTLEAEMFRDPANETVLRDAFVLLHPKSVFTGMPSPRPQPNLTQTTAPNSSRLRSGTRARRRTVPG